MVSGSHRWLLPSLEETSEHCTMALVGEGPWIFRSSSPSAGRQLGGNHDSRIDIGRQLS